MNGMTTPVKKKLSGASVVSIIFGIVFAVAAACMVFLPIVSISSEREIPLEWNGVFVSPGSSDPDKLLNIQTDEEALSQGSVLDASVIGKLGQRYMSSEIKAKWEPYANGAGGTDTQDMYRQNNLEVIFATVAFFGMLGVAFFVLLGKLLQKTGGGRALALIFSLLGFLMAGGFLAFTIIYFGTVNTFYAPSSYATAKANIGIGPILMASFAFLSFIFCCIGVGKKSAFKKTAVQPSPYDPNSYYAPQNNMPSAPAPQPVPPQNMGYADLNQPFVPQPPQPQPFQQPQQPAAYTQPPVMQQPTQYTQPSVTPPVTPPQVTVQPSAIHIQRQPEDEQPTVAQNGAIEGVSGDYAGAVINLKPGEKIMIGRDATVCNIILSADRKDISRRHCSVMYDPYTDSFRVVDMSSNGTYVNGQQMVRDQEMQLPVGTVIALGNGENQFRLKRI